MEKIPAQLTDQTGRKSAVESPGNPPRRERQLAPGMTIHQEKNGNGYGICDKRAQGNVQKKDKERQHISTPNLCGYSPADIHGGHGA